MDGTGDGPPFWAIFLSRLRSLSEAFISLFNLFQDRDAATSLFLENHGKSTENRKPHGFSGSIILHGKQATKLRGGSMQAKASSKKATGSKPAVKSLIYQICLGMRGAPKKRSRLDVIRQVSRANTAASLTNKLVYFSAGSPSLSSTPPLS